eukprot:TRINITY_DN1020_c0_g2_i2.p1 TRINITY_DN1020_c0_g2~~TRINITY_DN1020_c0_g2_i2.p1  ORF type:complete len:123 (+),score=41.18 TRINITY_DN1020_c0_g2_i2:122-490(+)
MSQQLMSELYAAAPYSQPLCEKYNRTFMTCKAKNPNPAACIALGNVVTACYDSVYDQLLKHCAETYAKSAYCIDKNTVPGFDDCQKERDNLAACVKSNIKFKFTPTSTSTSTTSTTSSSSSQ